MSTHFGQCYPVTNTADMTVPSEWEIQWSISDRNVRREPRQGAAPQLMGLQTNLKMKQYTVTIVGNEDTWAELTKQTCHV